MAITSVIKSVLATISENNMLFFKIPISVCNKLDGLRRKVSGCVLTILCHLNLGMSVVRVIKGKRMIGFMEDEGYQ